MKKTIALILAIALLFALSACGKKQESKDPIQESAEAASQAAAAAQNSAPEQNATAGEQAAQNESNAAQTGDGDAAGQNAEQAPASTVNFDEVNNTLGARLSAPTVVTPENETLQVLEENGAQIAQYTFLVGGIPCGVRFSPDFTADISGVTDQSGGTPFTGEGDEVINIPGAILARWVTVDGQYVLIVADENPENFNALLEDFKALSVS